MARPYDSPGPGPNPYPGTASDKPPMETRGPEVTEESRGDFPQMEYPVTVSLSVASPGAYIELSATYDTPTPEKLAEAADRLTAALTVYTADRGPTKVQVSRAPKG